MEHTAADAPHSHGRTHSDATHTPLLYAGFAVGRVNMIDKGEMRVTGGKKRLLDTGFAVGRVNSDTQRRNTHPCPPKNREGQTRNTVTGVRFFSSWRVFLLSCAFLMKAVSFFLTRLLPDTCRGISIPFVPS